MPILKVKKPFSWAHQHVNVKDYAKGDEIETDDADLIRVSAEEGWVTQTDVTDPEQPPSKD